MTLEELRQHIIKSSGIDILTKSRSGIIPVIKSVFVQTARKFCLDSYGKKKTVKEIGAYMNLHHTTISHHLSRNLNFHLGADPIIKKIYYHFFPQNEKTIQDYIQEIEGLQREIEEIKKSVLIN